MFPHLAGVCLCRQPLIIKNILQNVQFLKPSSLVQSAHDQLLQPFYLQEKLGHIFSVTTLSIVSTALPQVPDCVINQTKAWCLV